ncbi:SDR family NAD(P)-dependent oxidoreductase [Nocardia sp. NPDC003482]
MTWHNGRRANGRTFLVTGASAGIGYFVAEQLAATGATIVLACRNPAKADLAMATIRTRVPAARLRSVPLDLADLSTLPATADALPVDRLDAIVLNAGILLDDPERHTTSQGHESMFATNHLAHFALTAHLAPRLAPNGRVVTVGSYAARSERLDLADLNSAHDYRPKRTYARSKLAQMIFAFELDRRLRARGSDIASIVAHPGGALDSLTPSRPPLFTHPRRLRALPAALALHGKHQGAETIVRTVLDPYITGGQLWGPGVLGLRGHPHRETPHPHMTDPTTAAALWTASVTRTGTNPFTAASSPER